MNARRSISILGSTGSIGCSAIELLKGDLKDKFEVHTLSFHSNAELAVKQALEIGAKTIIATSREGFEKANNIASGTSLQILEGTEALKNACKNPSTNIILLAIVGVCGLEFALESIIRENRILAIANKEAIICGHHLMQKKLLEISSFADGLGLDSKALVGTKIIPVDSEHNSLFRLLAQDDSISSGFITASGGAFAGRKFAELSGALVADVVRHPIWSMGAKISVDSATMANKGLELIEAYNLFGFEGSKLQAYISKGSIAHAGVVMKDKSIKLFLSSPNMKNHIAHAILGGEVADLSLPEVNLLKTEIKFEEIKKDEFPIFHIAKTIAESREIKDAIAFNILNEIAVAKFLAGKIKYTEILKIIEEGLTFQGFGAVHTFEEILEFQKYLNTKHE